MTTPDWKRFSRQPFTAADSGQDKIHYSWQLHNADGDWQAGGDANNLDDVRQEGNRYLQAYMQDGPHRLIIQRHCVTTLEEVANDACVPKPVLAQPEAEGPTDEELLGLDELRDAWNAQADASNSWDELGMDEIIWFAQQQALARWGRPAPAPIPVAERLPREEEDGHWCWAGMEVDDVWEWTQLSTFRFGSLHQSYTHWLPHWAMRLPAGTEEGQS